MPWIVICIKRPPAHRDYFRDDFFPRRFAYKRDALELKQEVTLNGGEAVVEKEVKPKKEAR